MAATWRADEVAPGESLNDIDEILQWLNEVGCEIDRLMCDGTQCHRNRIKNDRNNNNTSHVGRNFASLHVRSMPRISAGPRCDESAATDGNEADDDTGDGMVADRSGSLSSASVEVSRLCSPDRTRPKPSTIRTLTACRRRVSRRRRVEAVRPEVMIGDENTCATDAAVGEQVNGQRDGDDRLHDADTRPIDTFERVLLTRKVWDLGPVTRAAAIHVLQNRHDGAFVVRNADVNGDSGSVTSSLLLYVREGSDVQQYPIQKTLRDTWKLLDSVKSFPSLPALITHYCQSRSGLHLVLPAQIEQATTIEQLQLIARQQSEFWVSILPPKACTSKPLQNGVSDQSKTMMVRSDSSHKFVASKTCQRVQCGVEVRTASSYNSSHTHVKSTNAFGLSSDSWTEVQCQSRVSHKERFVTKSSFNDKASDYEDVWTTSTPIISPVAKVKRTLPSHIDKTINGELVSQGACIIDPQKYQLGRSLSDKAADEAVAGTGDEFRLQNMPLKQQPQPVFSFDSATTSHCDHIGNTKANCQMALSTGDLRPSPLYAEPFDALPDRLKAEKKWSSVRQTNYVSNVKINIFPPSGISHPVNGSSPGFGAPVSAGYREPCDALVNCIPGCSTVPPPLPPREAGTDNQHLVIPRVTVTVDDGDGISSCSQDRQQNLRSCGARDCRHSQQSLVSDRMFACSDDDTQGNLCCTPNDRQSDYDNLSIDEPAPSRRMTGSSMRTQYSPPWDGDRWRELLVRRSLSSASAQKSYVSNGNCHTSAGLSKADVKRLYADTGIALPDEIEDFNYSEVESETDEDPEFFGTRPQRDLNPCSADQMTSADEWVQRVESDSVRSHCQMQTSHLVASSSLASAATTPYRVPGLGTICSWKMPQQKSPDVIPSLTGPKLISPQNRGHKFPGAKIGDFIVELTQKKPESMLGALVNNFVQCTINGTERDPRIVVCNIRQFMSGIKNYLTNGGEAELDKFVQTFRAQMKPTEFLNLDAIMERAMLKCIVKPLKEHVYRLFLYDYTRNGNLQKLCDGLRLARTMTPPHKCKDLDTASLRNEVQHFLELMEKTYSPLKKLENLLGAMTAISSNIATRYQATGASRIRDTVATDDLLSTLVMMLAQQNMQSAEIEASYMWGLIHQSFLIGDSRYYLTTFSSAVDQLKSINNSSAVNKVLPASLADIDGSITVITADETCNTISRHSLPVRPATIAKDICGMLAYQLRITNPQDYGLYLLSSGSEKWLPDDVLISCTAKKSTSSIDRPHFMYVYKRIKAHFVWSQSMIDL